MDFVFEQIRTGGDRNLAYLVGDRRAGVAAAVDPSYVLLAMGRDTTLAQSAIRFGLGRGNTEEEVDYTVETIATQVRKLRSMSVHYTMKQHARSP